MKKKKEEINYIFLVKSRQESRLMPYEYSYSENDNLLK